MDETVQKLYFICKKLGWISFTLQFMSFQNRYYKIKLIHKLIIWNYFHHFEF